MSILATHDQVPQIIRPTATVPHRLAPPASTGMTGKDILRAIRRRIWVIIISVVVTSALVGVGTELWGRLAPFYTAEAFLEIKPPKLSMLIAAGTDQASREVMDRMATQFARMCQSEHVMLAALKLENVADTQWYNDNPGTAINRIMEDVKVTPMANEGLIRISMMGRDRAELIKIVNAVATASVQDSADVASRQSRQQMSTLRDEMESRTAEQTEVERKKAVIRPADIPMIEERRNSLTIKLQQLSTQIVQLQAMKVQAEAGVDQIKKMDMRNSAEVLMAVDQDPNLRSLRMVKVNLQTELANALRKYGPSHRLVMDLQSRVSSIDQQIAQTEEDLTRKSIAAVTSSRQAVLDNVTAQLLELTSQMEATQGGMKGLQDTLEKMASLDVQSKNLAAQISQLNNRLMDLRLLNPTENPVQLRLAASVPQKPTWPMSFGVMMTLGVLFGLVVGFLLTFLLEFMDTSIKSPADITRRVDLPVLGMVPHSDDLEEEIEDLRLAFASNPNSLVSEAFRQIRTCLLFSGPANQRRSVLVASAQPEDGRTTVSVNLAASMARSGRKVLVVDANFRQPAIRKLFPKSPEAGLSNVLVGQGALREQVCEVEPNLWVMSSGPLPPNPGELLGGEGMRQFIAEATGQYEQVIFDGAPVLVVSDSSVLATLVDGVVLVVRAGTNTHGIVQRAREMLQRVGARLLGVVLNGVRATAGGYLRKSYETFYDYHEQALPGDTKAPPQ